MSSFATKGGNYLSGSSFGASKTMKSSELRGTRSFGNPGAASLSRAIFDKQSNTAEFWTQFTASNAEVDATKFDLEQLMVRADPFCANSGLGTSGVHLAIIPPRRADTPSGGHRPKQGTYFFAAPMRKFTS
jgi:hypothetical protein